MSETGGETPEPVTAASSHRAEPPPRTVVDRVLAPLAAVIVVVVVIVLLIVINGHGSNTSASGAKTSPPTIVTTGPGTPVTSPPTSPSASHHPSSSPHHSASTAATKPPKPSHSGSLVSTAMAPVQVLNNSRRTGLAHEVAAEVQARGWTISLIGNLQGLIPVPTVFYAPGDAAAARHLAREFSSVQRVEPNSDAGLHASGLTLVLTADWAD